MTLKSQALDASLEPKPEEVIWLRELERRAIEGEPPDTRVMMVQLRNSLPSGFRPESINRRFLYDQGLSVEGLRAIGDSRKLLPDVEHTIKYVRDRLIANPFLTQVTAADVGEALNVPPARAETLLGLLGSLAGSFYSGAMGSRLGVQSISFGEGSTVLSEYLAFSSLDKFFDRKRDEGGLLKQPISWSDERNQVPTIVPDSVFILMSMDPNDASLVDVHNAIREECFAFDLIATRIDDIEHQDRITDKILERIETAEFIVADLSGEKPNVYYEVGYSHALGKRPVLVRKIGTRLHFDLVVHNVPEYRNVTDLRAILRKRFEAILGRSARHDPAQIHPSNE